jgi:predicted  nucleic acid-binding Zn-ribbon protein
MKQSHRILDYFSACPARSLWGALSLALLLCMAGVSLHAEASDKKASRERAALRRVQQQLSQVQGQISALEQEKAKLAEDLDKAQESSVTMNSKAKQLQRELDAGKQRQTSLGDELAHAREELAAATRNLAETRNTLAETTRTLQQTESEKRDLQAIKAFKEREISSCEGKNVALYELGRSLMERFEHKSCGEALIQNEPFTGLKKVETENLLEEYRDKLDEQRLVRQKGD